MNTTAPEKAPAAPKRTPAATPAVPFWVRLNTVQKPRSARTIRRAKQSPRRR